MLKWVLYWSRMGLGGSLAKDLPSYRENIVKAQSRRFSPPRHEKVIRVRRTLEILCVCGVVTGKK